jgi:hypothetical protein
VQDILAGQLTDSDAAAVEAEFEELEAQALAAEVAAMPTVPDTPQQTAVGQQAGTSTQQPAAAEAEELPSVPTTKVRVVHCGVVGGYDCVILVFFSCNPCRIAVAAVQAWQVAAGLVTAMQ